VTVRSRLARLWSRTPDYDLARRFPPPEVPWSDEYKELHARFVAEMLDTERVLERFAEGGRLPRTYGVGLDERTVELPWMLAQRPHGRVLDAGSSLNHAHVLDRVLPLVDDLHVVTLVPEEQSFPERGVSYLYADLRDLPLQDDLYDAVVCVSTLEHVGMDTARFGGESARAEDPAAEARTALSELRRVARPGAMLLLTLPYGQPEDHGWFRQFGRADVEELRTELGGPETTVYAYSAHGWQLSSLEDASAARYHEHGSDPKPVPDAAAGARAVVCVRAVL
jgi:SAM-dependent methyltransferase